MDSKDSTTFVLFDQEASNLLNKSCANLVEKYHKTPEDSNMSQEILNLIDKTFLFKIEVDNSSNAWFEPSYKVKRVCSDPEIIKQFKNANPQLDGSPPYMLLSTPTSGGLMESSSSSFAKDLNEDFNTAVIPIGSNLVNESTVKLSKNIHEGNIVLAPVRELKMQYSSNPKNNLVISDTVSKGKGSISHNPSDGPSSVSGKEAVVGAVVSANFDSQIDGSSPAKSTEQTKEPNANFKLESIANKTPKSFNNKVASADADKNPQVCEKDVSADGILPGDSTIGGATQKQFKGLTNVSPPLKRSVHADQEAITTEVEKKKVLKVIKKEKI